MLGNGHVRFGGRAQEMDQPKDRHHTSARPNTHVKAAGRWTYLSRYRRPTRKVIIGVPRLTPC
jgi:hypothetical protein